MTTEEINIILKSATMEITSDGELCWYDLKGMLQDEKQGCFSISVSELVRIVELSFEKGRERCLNLTNSAKNA